MDVTTCATRLLAWYDAHARQLPWRVPPLQSRQGVRPEAYHVWLSEIMLQQTTVAAVQSYFRDFTSRWPTIEALAAAERDEVLEAWAGLGYYARARNLHACARIVAGELGGCFPETEDGLQALPGIGPYTSAAIAAIAFHQPAVVVDGNVERVMARLWAIKTPLPDAKPEIRQRAQEMSPHARPGDYAQAAMDLGATICTPRAPNCSACPISSECQAHGMGIADQIPARKPKKARPTRYGAVFWLERADGALLLHRRPDKGLLGGMMGFPGTLWGDAMPTCTQALTSAPLPDIVWRAVAGRVRHTFTHFHLELTVYRGAGKMEGGHWGHPPDFTGFALPSLMIKVARHVISSGN